MSAKIEGLVKAADEAKARYDSAALSLAYADSQMPWEIKQVDELKQVMYKAERELKAALDEAAALAAEEADK